MKPLTAAVVLLCAAAALYAVAIMFPARSTDGRGGHVVSEYGINASLNAAAPAFVTLFILGIILLLVAAKWREK